MRLSEAFAPYIFLAIVAIVVLAIDPVRSALQVLSIGLPFPATETGFGLRVDAVEAYASFSLLTHPGTFLLLASLFGYGMFKKRGRYARGTTVRQLFSSAAQDALPVTTSVTALLLMSGVMSHSGEITVLALGLSAAASSTVYLAAANAIGAVGSLTTSSNTASNVLFGPLQATGAQVEGVDVSVAVGAQVAGAAVGNAISPADALLGATTVSNPSLVSGVLRVALPWALGTGLLISLATIFLASWIESAP